MFPPQAVDITSCGNFVVIALSSGHIDVYNMQSGFHRGHYGQDKGESLLFPVVPLSVNVRSSLVQVLNVNSLLN